MQSTAVGNSRLLFFLQQHYHIYWQIGNSILKFVVIGEFFELHYYIAARFIQPRRGYIFIEQRMHYAALAHIFVA